jgi:hypothetical protein
MIRTRLALAGAASVAALASVLAGPTAAANAAPAAPHACRGSAIHVGHGRSNGATGHVSVVLYFRNTGSVTCTLRGYPGVDALARDGHVLKHARRTLNGFTGGAKSVRTIAIAPGRRASAQLEAHDFNFRTSGDCRASESIAVTPPNTARTAHLFVRISVCDLQIHPVVAGSSGDSRR